jgi:hypothetical protein
MKDRDKFRFRANLTWFNQFFEGLRQIYQHVAELLPKDYFPDNYALNLENYYYPTYKAVPSIPPYFALMMEGNKCALQIVSVVDASLFSPSGQFFIEPTMVIVVISTADKYARLDEFALQVIRNQNVEVVNKTGNIMRGKFTAKFPAEFFAFQVQYDRFTDDKKPEIAIRKYIIDPITTNLMQGFSTK